MAARQSSRTAGPIRYEPTPARTSRRPGVCVVEGYGVSVAVRQGRLVIRDGLPGERRERIIPRVQARVRPAADARPRRHRHVGGASLVGRRRHLVHPDRPRRPAGRHLHTHPGDARLRRAQALATVTPAGLEVSRWLLEQKLAGQQQAAHRAHSHPAIQNAFQERSTGSQCIDRW